ncbi:MAG: DegT/DnrJ/EryC1/StrS family aminotransferase [Halioglobus sp.]
MLPNTIVKIPHGKRPAIANVKTTLPIFHARNGLAIIAKAILTPGSKVLLPAYHCPALVEPFVWAGCDIDFYPLNEDLSPDAEVLKEKLPTAEAIVLVPFFGFSRDIAALVELARENQCIPIDDLAHAAHSSVLHGDYGVTSLVKFYPVTGGGELLIANSVANTAVENWWQANRFQTWQWMGKQLFRKAFLKLRGNRPMNHAATSRYRYFDPKNVGEPIAPRDIRQIACQDHEEIAFARRDTYQKLDNFFRESRLGQPLFTGLGPNDVPYVYPFVLNKPEYFDVIRNLAIPLYRWEELCPSGCETSNTYRDRLIQLPCHQDMDDNDIGKLISKLKVIEDPVYISV